MNVWCVFSPGASDWQINFTMCNKLTVNKWSVIVTVTLYDNARGVCVCVCKQKHEKIFPFPKTNQRGVIPYKPLTHILNIASTVLIWVTVVLWSLLSLPILFRPVKSTWQFPTHNHPSTSTQISVSDSKSHIQSHSNPFLSHSDTDLDLPQIKFSIQKNILVLITP